MTTYAPTNPKDYLQELTSRTRGITGGLLEDRHVAFVGVGASINLIKGCVRSGLTNASLFDLDIVELPNLGRTAFEFRDLGIPKVEAARAHLHQVNPHCTVHCHDGDFLEFTDEELAKLLDDVDVVVMGTDVQTVQLRGNAIGRKLGKRMVFPGFYKRAEGGEIVIVTPETPCYRCQVRSRFEGEQAVGEPKGDLKAESGLIFDCDHLDSIVGKIVLAMLLKDDIEDFHGFYKHMIRNSLVFSKHHPGFTLEGVDIFGDFFGSSPLAFSYQTLWLDPSSWRDPSCPICGADNH